MKVLRNLARTSIEQNCDRVKRVILLAIYFWPWNILLKDPKLEDNEIYILVEIYSLANCFRALQTV